jgi:peptidoglycan/LPS O-acetylase OafA/YrhL
MQKPFGSSSYRADIDGLRAIAVLSVMIYHARDTALPGGFVGVDIFFVISGYLISRHIAAEVSEDRFSLIEFYRRRIRRIVPMMMVIVAAVLAAALLVMTPEDARAVAKSAVWSIASMANIHFWRDLDTGYFANSSAEVPLLHLWSLGVEEQFYLVWPLLLAWGIRKLSPRWLLGLMLVVSGMSFGLAEFVFPRDASFAYYMLPTRMGELLVGAIAGVAMVVAPIRIGKLASRVAGWVGLALIGASLLAINRLDPFPGWLAIPPTLGAVLLILAGEQRRTPIPGLASGPLVFIGKISYSAYLWHWPLFAFYRYGYGEPGWPAAIGLLGATLLLAWLSLELIERPTRGTGAGFAVVFGRQFVIPSVVVLVPAFAVVYANRIDLPLASEAYLTQLAAVRETTRPAFTHDWVCQRQRLSEKDLGDPRCVLGAPKDASQANAEPNTILWGDSNAAHYVPMVREFATQAGTRFRNVAVGSCPPILSDPAPFVEAHRLSDCNASATLMAEQIRKYPVVLIAAAWVSYDRRSPRLLESLSTLLHEMVARGQHVVLIGNAPVVTSFDARCQEKALRLPFKHCDMSDVPLPDNVKRINEKLRSLALDTAGVSYFDGNNYLCPEDKCKLLTATHLPRFIDVSHLSVQGSTELGRKVLSAQGLPDEFSGMKRRASPSQ